MTAADGTRTLRNIDMGTYLAGQGSWQVGQVASVSPDARWGLSAADDGSFYLTNIERDRNLSARRVRIHLSTAETAAQRWTFEPVGGPAEPTRYVGEQILIQSQVTDQWLASHPARTVDQSAETGDNTTWLVFDAGGGYVYLQNAASGRFADASNRARDGDVRTSATARGDDRWLLIEDDGFVTIQNALTRGYVTALGAADDFNVTEGPIESAATQWHIFVALAG